MASAPRLVLIDASWLIFRAYYAIPSNFSTASGLPTNAIYGFALMFGKLLSGKQPDFGACVFDAPGKTFRDEKFPDYKANRPAMDDDLKVQLPYIRKVVSTHNFPILRQPGFEADDVIGTLATRAAKEGIDVQIISGDKDFAQLISDRIHMTDTMRDVTYDPELVRKKWGVPPEQFIDYLALLGDKIDNIPGVPGIGKKSAIELLKKHGDLETIIAHVDELKTRRRNALKDNIPLARTSRELATIDTDVALPLSLPELAIQAPDVHAVNELYKELEFYSLLTREARPEAKRAAGNYTVCGSVAAVEEALGALGTQPCAVQLISDLIAPGERAIVGFGFSPEPEQGFYVPVNGPEGLGEPAFAPLRAYFGDAGRPKIVHEVKVLWRELQRVGIEATGFAGDTRLASFLIDPNKVIPHDLNRVVKEFLHRTVPPVKGVVGSGKSEKAFAEVVCAKVGRYACALADAVGQLWPLLKEQLEERGQTRQLFEHDIPLAYVLGRMELAGIKVDKPDLKAMDKELCERLDGHKQKIYALAGKEFNVASTKQLSAVLFEDLGLPVIKRTKTGYSTAVTVLEKLSEKGHEIADVLLEHRKLDKLINTYTRVLRREVNPRTGRIHATFQQTVGVTGRLITTDPDLQRTPVKTPEGRRIRQCFIPEPGHRLISADWSQIELRLLAHVSKDERLVEAFEKDLDIHRRTASQLFGCALEEVTPKQRGVGKTVNFATIYGQGATALGQILKVPRQEAKRYIEGYFEAYAGVREWLDDTIAKAHGLGYVETLLGRRRYIPELSSRNFMEKQAGERIAANTPIQGSAADICKLVMLALPPRLREAGLRARMLLQIHDELVFEAPEDEVEATMEIVRDAMEHAYPLDVPLKVDVGSGKSWDEAH